jgi:hypothetical protein
MHCPGEKHKKSDIRSAVGSIKRYERGREVKNLHCPATVKGTKADMPLSRCRDGKAGE